MSDSAAMAALAAYVASNGPVFWLTVSAVMLALEAMSGRAWWIWGAFGAGVAALLSLWLNLSLLLEIAAFVAAALLGMIYSLQMRIAAARQKAQRQA